MNFGTMGYPLDPSGILHNLLLPRLAGGSILDTEAVEEHENEGRHEEP